MARCLTNGETTLEEEAHFQRFDDTHGTLLGSAAPIYDAGGKLIGAVSVFADITEQVRARTHAQSLAAELKARVNEAQLGVAVSSALTGSGPLSAQLDACANALVVRLGAAFARIWTASADGKVLELEASAGLYTHRDGPHGRIPVGEFKIGLIAQEGKPHLTNDVQNDPKISDPAWAAREGMCCLCIGE